MHVYGQTFHEKFPCETCSKVPTACHVDIRPSIQILPLYEFFENCQWYLIFSRTLI